jgi:hypothetical protein
VSSIGAYSVASVRYSFFVHRTAPRWRLVIAESGSFPERTTPGQWQHSRDRAEADTNPDVRAEVQRQGYCLFAISASFDELDRDLRSSRLPGETVVRGSQALTLAVRETQP